jgi:hypothetical protein
MIPRRLYGYIMRDLVLIYYSQIPFYNAGCSTCSVIIIQSRNAFIVIVIESDNNVKQLGL